MSFIFSVNLLNIIYILFITYFIFAMLLCKNHFFLNFFGKQFIIVSFLSDSLKYPKDKLCWLRFSSFVDSLQTQITKKYRILIYRRPQSVIPPNKFHVTMAVVMNCVIQIRAWAWFGEETSGAAYLSNIPCSDGHLHQERLL